METRQEVIAFRKIFNPESDGEVLNEVVINGESVIILEVMDK